MKPLHFVVSPTRIRPLNTLLGLALILVSLLLIMALGTYAPNDPSLNTASGPVAPHNWIEIGRASCRERV